MVKTPDPVSERITVCNLKGLFGTRNGYFRTPNYNEKGLFDFKLSVITTY